jgi:general secretion pathway protein D
MKRSIIGLAVLSALLTAACAPHKPRQGSGTIERAALEGVDRPVPSSLPLAPEGGEVSDLPRTRKTSAAREIEHGTGRFIRPRAADAPHPVVSGKGAVTLNFEDQPVEAVVKAILGDLLAENYSLAPGVQGTISFSTSRPVGRDDALPILETLLAWTGNALVREHGRYSVLPAHQAVAGRLVPSLKAAKPGAGLSARLFPLHHVAAPAMAKLLAPFATADAILLADAARNVLVVAGTRDELANYGETIDTFDVDWVAGMSVGVFGLEHASVGELLPALDSVFGEKSGAPVAGLIRFMPIERTNALVVIATQAAHLDQVGEWIARIDRGGGNEPRLFVYDVRHLLASDLARYVTNVFGASAQDPPAPVLAPGLTPSALGDGGDANANEGNTGGDGQSTEQSSFFEPPQTQLPAAKGGDGAPGIRVTAIDTNNQLMVRARPSQWSEIRQALERLDAIPLQVQIETRILEVTLRDEFRFGVQWYLEGMAGGNGAVAQPGNKQRWSLGGGHGLNGRPDTLYYSFVNKDLQVVLHAMQQDDNAKILSAPSLVVVNNRKARIQVGDQIPVTQTYVNTALGGNSQVGQVAYKDTGVILDVRPRVNPGGLVYLDVAQEVSRAGIRLGDNVPIIKRKLTTQVAVQSGQTVLLGGLIQESETRSRGGVPFLSRVPFLGALFRTNVDAGERTELIVLITPKVITGGEDAKRVSDDYRRAFRSLRPFEAAAEVVPTAAGDKAEG